LILLPLSVLAALKNSSSGHQNIILNFFSGGSSRRGHDILYATTQTISLLRLLISYIGTQFIENPLIGLDSGRQYNYRLENQY
jgi:hypothetical protein